MLGNDLIAFKSFVQQIVEEASKLKDKHTDAANALVNYACIFSQSDIEFEMYCCNAELFGSILQQTSTGPLFHIEPTRTVAGDLELLKVRRPDETRIELGDADFTLSDYVSFKAQYLYLPGFSLVEREKFEMIELVDPSFNVRAYFSCPTLLEQFGLASY